MESATLTRRRPGSNWVARARAAPAGWEAIAFLALCVAALIGYFAFPTYPTYDSFYALLWGRDLLHLHLPDFSVYRAPTEHPLAIPFGAFCSIFGQGGAGLMVLGSIASFVAAVAGMYRLGRLCFGPVVGLVAALLLLSRFFVENLAAQGYLDISYVALVVWAVVLEVEKPRRGWPVFLTLAAAGLLRPDAWVLSGVYWLWCSWRAPNSTRARYLALAAIAPVIWFAVDGIITGNPLYSLPPTAGPPPHPTRPPLARARGDRPRHLVRCGRDHHRQPALFAHRDSRPRRRTRTHARVRRCPRLGVELRGTHRSPTGARRRADRNRPVGLDGTEAGARAAGDVPGTARRVRR